MALKQTSQQLSRVYDYMNYYYYVMYMCNYVIYVILCNYVIYDIYICITHTMYVCIYILYT